MKIRFHFRLGSVLVLFILVAAASTSITAPQNITITIPVDGKCTMERLKSIPPSEDISLEVIENTTENGTVGIAILSLDPDKTIKDLEKLAFDGP